MLQRKVRAPLVGFLRSSIRKFSVAREQLQYDVCIVGAGPAGLSAAIRLKTMAKEKNQDLNVCVLDKGSEIGSHILSGNVLETRALDELLPDWKDDPEAPIKVKTTKDYFYLLPTDSLALRLPVPKPMANKGNYVVSLSEVCRWLGKKAESMGVDVFPGFAAKSLLYDWEGTVVGVSTNDFGVGKDGKPKAGFSPGVDLKARVTLLAEGARGSLSQEAMSRFQLRAKQGADPQTYALGIKEVWEVPAEKHQPGTVVHTVGYPLDQSTYGGGFIYHMDNRRVALGYVISLDYANPHLNTYGEFQRWKSHPAVRKHIEGGTCIQYGARSLNEGGLQSVPQLHFPGGALVGCAAGFLNVPKIKGTHTAMASGTAAAEATYRVLFDEEHKKYREGPINLELYQNILKSSWVYDELNKVRNIRPGFRFGLIPGLLHAAVDWYLLRGKAPWTLHHKRPDHEHLKAASECAPIDYPKPDGQVTFDLPTSLFRSGTNHEHDQPAHLKLADPGVPERLNDPHYAGPETRYCPAGVYEYNTDANGRRKLQINAQNCLHCKACDIKDPSQNIKWTVPEGGGGPNYTVM